MKNNSSINFTTVDPHRCNATALYCFVINLYTSKTIQYIDFKQHFFYLFGNPFSFSITGGSKPSLFKFLLSDFCQRLSHLCSMVSVNHFL